MYKVIAVFTIAVLGFSACKKKQEDILVSISKQKEKINKDLKKYTLRTADDIVSKERGIISGYFRDEEVKKVYTQYFGTENRSFTEYYFDDGMLIYVLSQVYIYNKPTTYTEDVAMESGDSVWYDDKLTKLEINRYFFDDNKLIKWTGPSNNDVPVNIADFSKKEPEIIAHALVALKHLKEE